MSTDDYKEEEEDDEVKDCRSICHLLEENLGIWKVEEDE